jgi:hypothetical protein
MDKFAKFAAVVVALFCLAAGTPPRHACQNSPMSGTKSQTGGKVVYVCACLRTRSCSCMSMAKTEGPCACGTAGGPPMKAVPADSAWAKKNRKELGAK